MPRHEIIQTHLAEIGARKVANFCIDKTRQAYLEYWALSGGKSVIISYTPDGWNLLREVSESNSVADTLAALDEYAGVA